MTFDIGERLYVVIPVHNRRRLTKECLLALREQTYANTTVVVVDDGSTDGTAEMLRDEFPEVVVVEGRGDLWWAGATNAGCDWALARAAAHDAVVTLNDDTTPGPDWLAQLRAVSISHPDALVGSVAVAGSERRIEGAAVMIGWWTAKFSAPYRGEPASRLRADAPAVVESDALSGKGTLVPVRALRELGPYAASLPHYGADYEFSIRAARRGWRLLVATQTELQVVPETTGIHASTEGPRSIVLRSLWSRRSANAIWYRLRFGLLACPRKAVIAYIACDLARVSTHTLRAFLAPRASAPVAGRPKSTD